MNNVWAFIPNRTEKMHQVWLLKKCLESLFDVEPLMANRVIICDDHSPLHEQMMGVIEKFPVKLMKHDKRSNYSHMINSGLKAVRSLSGEGIITINNDIEHKTTFLSELNNICESDKNVSIIGPLLFYPDGKIQHGGVEITSYNQCIDNCRGEYMAFSEPRYCHHTTGAWQFIKMKGLRNLYNERFDFGFEDADFSMRLWENGQRSFFTNKIHHIHHESVTRGSILGPREMANSNLFRNQIYDHQKINDEITKATTERLLG